MPTELQDLSTAILTGAEAIWANKKYRGHRVLPHNIVNEVNKSI
jgi:hypothetical protein